MNNLKYGICLTSENHEEVNKICNRKYKISVDDYANFDSDGIFYSYGYNPIYIEININQLRNLIKNKSIETNTNQLIVW
jgi:hypothetical protein